jgi:hypothetical protein
MTAVLLLVVAVALAFSAARLPVRRALIVVVAAVLLIPATLSVPNPLTPDLTVTRLVVLGFVAGLIWRTAKHELPAGIWRPGPVHALAALYVVVTFVAGVGLAIRAVTPLAALGGWLDVVDQMVLLVAAIAAFRAINDDSYVLKVFGVGLLTIAVIGFLEHVTGQSWAKLWFTGIHSQAGSLEARDLVKRSGEVRVRGAAQFALEYAWLCVLLTPAMIAAALIAWRRRWLLVPATALVLGAVVWSVTRSAIPALGVAVLLLALFARDKRFFAMLGVTVTVAALAVLARPGLTGKLSESVDSGSVAVRSQRLPLLLQLSQEHKVTGLGFGGLNVSGLPTTDAGWLRIYAEVGTVGLVALVVLFVTVLGYVSRGLFALDPSIRATSAAALTALVLAAFAGFVYDTFTVMTTGRVIWLVAALGLVSGERVAVLNPVYAAGQWRDRMRRAAIAGAGGLLIGTLAYFVWPQTTAIEARFELFPAVVDVGDYDAVDTGKVLLESVCGAAGQIGGSGFTVQCRSTEQAAGEGIMRISGRSLAAVNSGLARVTEHEQGLVPTYRVVTQTAPKRGVPAPVADGPLGLALLGIAAAFLLPTSMPRRRTLSWAAPAGTLQGALQ